jgi:hypothetical protein
MGVAIAPPVDWVETLQEIRLDEWNLHIYLQYRFLPVDQQARIFLAVADVHRCVMATVADRRLAAIPFVITSVQTGNSIDCKFGGRFPKTVITDSGDLEIWIPKWAVGLAVASAIIGTAASTLKSADDIWDVVQKRKPAIVELGKQAYDLTLLALPDRAPAIDLERALSNLAHELGSENITTASVDGIILKKKEDDEQPPSRGAAAV